MTKKKSNAWVDDYLKNEEYKDKQERPVTLDEIFEVQKKIDSVRRNKPKEQISKLERNKLRQLEYILDKKQSIYSNLGKRIKKPSIEGGTPILNPEYRRFRK